MALRNANVDAFVHSRRSKTNDKYCQIAYRSSLHCKEIATEVRFAKSLLLHNPDVHVTLKVLAEVEALLKSHSRNVPFEMPLEVA